MPGYMNSLIYKVRFSAQNMPISGDVGAETPRRDSQRLGRERERDRAFPNEAVSQTDIDSDYRLSETLPQTEQRNPAALLCSDGIPSFFRSRFVTRYCSLGLDDWYQSGGLVTAVRLAALYTTTRWVMDSAKCKPIQKLN